MFKKLFPIVLSILFVLPMADAQAPAPEGKVPLSDLAEILTPDYRKRYLKEGKPFTGTTYDSYAQNKTILVHEIENGYIQMIKGWKFSGAIERVYHFKDGLPHGKLTAYFENGQKYFEETYVKGLQHGQQYGWYEDGSLRLEQEFINGAEIKKLEYPRKSPKGQ